MIAIRAMPARERPLRCREQQERAGNGGPGEPDVSAALALELAPVGERPTGIAGEQADA
jgi:hypothetical protein